MSTLTYHDLAGGFGSLRLGDAPVVVHVSLSSFGAVQGGAASVVGALLTTFSGVIAPTFTYQTMVVPEEGPAGNGMAYGTGRHSNRLAVGWSPDMPADRLMGAVPEALRRHRSAQRSDHPILSFSGVRVAGLLANQPLDDPLAPLRALAAAGGWVLLAGVDHSVNTSLHVAEQLAGRKTFVRWALAGERVLACPNFPGCSNGFPALEESLAGLAREVVVGRGRVRAFSAQEMIDRARAKFEELPRGYLCKRIDCGRCNALRGN